VTVQAQRFEILEMVQAAKRAMGAACLFDVIDLEAVGFAELAIVWIRSPRRLVSAVLAAIFVAAFYRATRERPPMIVPEALRAAIAAPHAPANGERIAAPAAAALDVGGKGTRGD
jgi:hypothetical protein